MATGNFKEFISDMYGFIMKGKKRFSTFKIRSMGYPHVKSCQNPDVAMDRKKKYKRKRRFTIKRIIKFFRKKLKL